MIQVTAAKIRGYGPWTLTLGHDREHRLQTLQASLYAEAQRLFSERDCLVFPNRHDEYVIVSNGLDEDGHRRIRDELKERFGVGLQMHMGRGTTPAAADHAAHRARVKDVHVLGEAGGDDVTILHMDVNDLTSRARDVPPYGVSVLMLELHLMMARHFAALQSLSFFMGGDNFMVLAGEEGRKGVRAFLDAVAGDLGLYLNCGIGRASTGRGAAMRATRSLDTIREIREAGSGPKPDIYEADCC
ncbi:MAG: GTP cyclohydrolase IIa [Nitrosopumilaceae archaeon]|nr:GTP cyclohydrolase IIa [Nitrosopumilaceae archaeon]